MKKKINFCFVIGGRKPQKRFVHRFVAVSLRKKVLSDITLDITTSTVSETTPFGLSEGVSNAGKKLV